MRGEGGIDDAFTHTHIHTKHTTHITAMACSSHFRVCYCHKHERHHHNSHSCGGSNPLLESHT